MLLLFLCILCTLIGLVEIRSVTLNEHTLKYVIVQLFAMAIGIGAYVIFTVIDPDQIAKKYIGLTVFSVGIIAGLIFFGVEDGTGNKAWYRFLGIGLQPSEIVKVIFIVLLAKQITLYKERKELNKFKSLVKLAIHWGLYFMLIVGITKDLGSALIFIAIFLVMLIAAGVAWYWLGIAAAAVVAMIPVFWNFLLADYQKNRILAPYIPDVVDPTGTGITWQTNICKEAMATGRFWGTGLGKGPHVQAGFTAGNTDYIFASIGEEMGMIGCIVVIVLLMLIIIRCCHVGARSGSNFGMLICFGVAASTAFQTFIETGMCIGISPVIGITLPFFSYGGSSIVAMFSAMGLVSGVRYRPKPKQHFIQY